MGDKYSVEAAEILANEALVCSLRSLYTSFYLRFFKVEVVADVLYFFT